MVLLFSFQAGKCIPKKESVINIEEISQNSLKLEEDYFGSLPKDSLEQDPKPPSNSTKAEKGEETVEELDSPER